MFAVLLFPGIPFATRAVRGILGLAFFVCVLLSASRAALLGIMLGWVVVWWLTGHRRLDKFFAMMVLAGAMLVLVFGAKALERLALVSSGEPSIAVRIKVYSALPAMMLSAPGGWGKGQSAAAYESWFQDARDPTRLKNLLSTHATWAAEFGWGFFLCYGSLWCVAFWISSPVAAGLLVCWWVCCALSHVGAVWWMWLVPVLGVLTSLRWRRPPTNMLRLFATMGGALMAWGVFFAWGLWQFPAKDIHFAKGILVRGQGTPRLWFLAPAPAVLGAAPGRALRTLESFALARRWADIPSGCVLVLSASPPDGIPDSLTLSHVIWLNPPSSLSRSERGLLARASRTTVFNGTSRQDISIPEWKCWSASLENFEWIALLGRPKFLGVDLGFLSDYLESLDDKRRSK